MSAPEKVFIRTYGCQMNDRDSEAVLLDLQRSGYQITEDESEADVLLFNTCSVRDQAERKALGKIGLIQALKRKNPKLKVGVLGCMAQSRGDEVMGKYGHVDFVAGTDQLHRIPQILAEVRAEPGKRVSATGLSRDILERLDSHPAGAVAAQVAVMRGCNEYCTYCIVPFTRGQEKSRPVASILAEVEQLAARGVREISYLGQNITAYGLIEARRDRSYDAAVSPFAELLAATAKIPGIERIRFTSPHARYFNDHLIGVIAAEPKISRGIHFPLQSGSDRILRLMRRRYSAAEFKHWVDKLKAAVPGVSFSTDIIVGFPGETEQEFEETRQLCADIGFDQMFIFRYSPRQGTPAAKMPGHLSEEEMMRRNQILLADLDARLLARNEALVGSVRQVLIEGPSKRNEARWAGRDENHKIVIFDPSPATPAGAIRPFRIERVTAHALYGSLAE